MSHENDDNPVAAAENAAEAMRALAHATRSFDDPADTYWTLGGILSTASRFIQVLEQVAEAHRSRIDQAHDDDGRRTAGRAYGLAAAADLHTVALTLSDVYRRLDHASQNSGRISWYPEPPVASAQATAKARRTRLVMLEGRTQATPPEAPTGPTL